MTGQPRLPPGFVLDPPEAAPQATGPRLPPGFVLDAPTPSSDAPRDPGRAADVAEEEQKSPMQMVDEFFSPVGHFAKGFNRWMTRAVQLPAEAVRWGAEKLGAEPETAETISKVAYPISYFGGKAMKSVADTGPEPATPGERIGARAGEMVASSLPLAAATLGAAPLIAGGTRAISPTVAPVSQAPAVPSQAVVGPVEKLAQGIVNAPRAAATGETIAATGSGVAGGVAEEVAPDSPIVKGVAEIAGGMAPGALPAAARKVLRWSPTRMVTQPAAEAAGAYIHENYPEIADVPIVGKPAAALAERAATSGQRAAEESAEKLLPPLTPRETRLLEQAIAEQEAIPGLKYSQGEATGSAPAIAAQEALEREAQGPKLQRAVERRAENIEAIGRAEEAARPQAARPLEYVVDTASGRVERLGERMDEELGALAERRRGLSTRTLPEADKAAAGQSLRTRLVQLRRAESQRMSGEAERLGLNKEDISAPFTEWSQRISKEFSPGSRFEDIGDYPDVVKIIERVGRKPPGSMGDVMAGKAPAEGAPRAVTFEDMKALRESLTNSLIDASSGTAPNRNKVRLLSGLRREVDKFIDEMPGDIGERYRQFRDTYRREFVERFEQGAAHKVLEKGGTGFYRTNDEQITDAFFVPGNGTTPARQFKTAYANDAGAAANLRAVVLDRVRQEAVDADGMIDPKKLATFQKRYAQALNEFPELRREIANVDLADRAIAGRIAQVEERSKALGRDILTRKLSDITGQTVTAEAGVDKLLADPRLFQRFYNKVRGDADAVASLRRHVWDKAKDLTPEGFTKFMSENGGSVRMLMEPKQLKTVEMLINARARATSVREPGGTPPDTDPSGFLKEKFGMRQPAITSRVRGVESGRESPVFIVTELASRYMHGYSKRQMNAVLERAIYDPNFARQIDAALKPGASPEKARRLFTRFSGSGESYPTPPGEEED